MLDLNLIQRYWNKGVIIDSNLSILLFIGRWWPALIESWKGTRDRGYTHRDFEMLNTLLSSFQQILATPHILAETNNFANHLKQDRKLFYSFMAKEIAILKESYIDSISLTKVKCYYFFGLNDASIEALAAGDNYTTIGGDYLVISDDSKLVAYLAGRGIEAINLTNLRFYNEVR